MSYDAAESRCGKGWEPAAADNRKSAIEIDSSIWREEIGNRQSTRQFGGNIIMWRESEWLRVILMVGRSIIILYHHRGGYFNL
jgi:hypothetical protein